MKKLTIAAALAAATMLSAPAQAGNAEGKLQVKVMATGGSVYDSRGLEEARKLIDTAQRTYPEIASVDQEWLERQLIGIHRQQATHRSGALLYKRLNVSSATSFKARVRQ